tara:strand:+ start:43213 stop:44010 length:798 start_codon:yes stop_codon:yes gene_type:complete
MTQMQQFDGTEHITMYHEPERTSLAAILGLVCSLIGCCFGVTAIIGLFLSIFGIVGISRSKGRVGGMGFAIAGVLIGILMLALWGAMAGGAFFAAKAMEKAVVQPVFTMLGDLETGDFDAARAVLGKPAADATDEELIVFRDGYQAMLGSVVSTPTGFMDYIKRLASIGEPIGQYQGANNMIPIPMEFDRGEGLVLIFFDQNSANGGAPIPTEVLIFDADGNGISLPAGVVVPASSGDAEADPELPGVDVEDFSDDSGEDADDGP